MKFKDMLAKKTYKPTHIILLMIVLDLLYTLVGGLLLAVSILGQKAGNETAICGIIASILLIVLGLSTTIFTPILLIKYPKYKNITHLIFKENLFFPEQQIEQLITKDNSNIQNDGLTELGEQGKENSSSLRKLKIKRLKKSITAIGKQKIYIEDYTNPEIYIDNVPCKTLCFLKNGQEKTILITQEEVRLFTLEVNKFGTFFTSYTILKGNEDVYVQGVRNLKHLKGGEFDFLNNN